VDNSIKLPKPRDRAKANQAKNRVPSNLTSLKEHQTGLQTKKLAQLNNVAVNQATNLFHSTTLVHDESSKLRMFISKREPK
jgi:hypothetical protein